MSDGRRPRRVAEDIRDSIASSLTRELSDPRLVGVVISRVETSPDLGLASVYFRSLQPATPRSINGLLRAFERASGRLRRRLAGQLRLKRVPELRFHYDEGPDARARVDELLHEIEHDQRSASELLEESPDGEPDEG